MISGLQQQKLKLKFLMMQQAEASQRSVEQESVFEEQHLELVLEDNDYNFAEFSCDIDKVQKVVDAERSLLKAAVQLSKELTAQVNALQADKDVLQAEQNRLQGESRLQEETIRVLENDMRERVSMQEYHDLSSLVQEKAKECERLEDIIVDLQVELKKATCSHGRAQQQCEAEEQRTLSLERDREALMSEIHSLKDALENEKLNLHSLQSLQREKDMRVFQLQGEKSDLMEQLQEERQKLEAECKRLNKTSQDKVRLQQEIEKKVELLKSDLAAERDRAKELECESERAALKVQQDKTKLQQELRNCTVTVEDLQAEVQRLNKSVLEKSRIIQELRGTQQEARELQEEVVELKTEVQRLTKLSSDKVLLSLPIVVVIFLTHEFSRYAHANACSGFRCDWCWKCPSCKMK
jgi:chromosome segregation ATPase